MQEFWQSLSHSVSLTATSIAVLSVLEWLIPIERQSLKSRFQGLLGWSLAYLAFPIEFAVAKYVNVSPMIQIDLSGIAPWSLAGFISPFIPLLVFDFFYYWFHRFQHKIPILWKYHAVHHSIREMNSLNSAHHWSENLWRAILLTLPMNFIIHITPLQGLGIFTLLHGWGIFIHSNTRLNFGRFGVVLADSNIHRMHHSIAPEDYDLNFAAFFPVWDVLFGTFKYPETEVKTGLVGHPQRFLAR